MYHLLQPGIESQPPAGSNIVDILQWSMRNTIVIAGILGFVFITVTGFQYMLTDKISNKSHLRQRLLEIFLGIILAVGSYVILAYINSDILSLDFLSNLKTAK